jgi:hypothetical protein
LYGLIGAHPKQWTHLTSAITDDRGRFRVALAAPANEFQIQARIRAHRPAFDSDYSCPLGFR